MWGFFLARALALASAMRAIDDFSLAAIFPSGEAEWAHKSSFFAAALGIIMSEAGNPAEKGHQQKCSDDHQEAVFGEAEFDHGAGSQMISQAIQPLMRDAGSKRHCWSQFSRAGMRLALSLRLGMHWRILPLGPTSSM